jgi:peptide/nickel transport system substrate-binding protein
MRRRDFIKGTTALAAGSVAAAGTAGWDPAWAQDRKDTLVAVSEGGPNSLDSEVTGANRACTEVTWNCYDRLITFGVKKDENGNDYYDHDKLMPELAEEWDLRDMSVTFKLRKDARFHDGTPVTAKDVKWSFERVLGNGGYPKTVYNAVSVVDPAQFVAVDDRTFRLDFVKHDQYTLPFICGSPVGFVFNSELVKKHVTEADPYGLAFTKLNVAGSGAYTVSSFKPGQEVVFVRNEDWKCGPLPAAKRVIWRMVPSAGTRRALLERGDVDLSFDLPPKDVSDLASNKDLNVISALMDCTVEYLSLNTAMPPFDDPRVRRAIAHAVPYDDIIHLALYGRGRSLAGGSGKVATPDWPQPGPYVTDLAKAKQLLAEAGHPDGFETTLSYDVGATVINEPIAILIQSSLAKIGVQVTLDKIPGANWRSEFGSKKLPMLLNIFGGWLSAKYFYFGWVYYGQGANIWNTANYRNPEMDRLIDEAHFSPDRATSDADDVRSIQLAFDDLPYVPLYQPTYNVATRKNISGYCYWFFQQQDYRKLVKT